MAQLDRTHSIGAVEPRRARSLPIRLEPLPEEGLDSWLEALASRSASAWADLSRAVGLADFAAQAGRGSGRSPFWLELTTRHILTVSDATGVEPSIVTSMTLAARLSLPAGAAFPHSMRLPGSRFCPVCLAERDGRWRSWWRLRWAFACPTHACLLVDVCPECGRGQRLRAQPGDLVPRLGWCTNSAPSGGRRPARCQGRLADATVRHLGLNHPAVQHQRQILDVLTRGSHSRNVYAVSPVPPHDFLRDLTALGQRMLRYGPLPKLCSRIPGELRDDLQRALSQRSARGVAAPSWMLTAHSSVAVVAAAACLAAPVLFSVSPAAAGQRLGWFVTAMRNSGLAVTASNVGWGNNVSDALVGAQLSALATHLGPTDYLRYRACTSRPYRRGATAAARSIPGLLWPSWALPFVSPGVGFEQRRSALSVATLLVGSRTPARSACASLGAATSPPAVSRVLQTLRAQPDWAERADRLVRLSDMLASDACPIDYERRRRLDYTGLLPDSLWRSICRDLGVPSGRGVKADLHRCWLYEWITGSPARRSPHAVTKPEFLAGLADLPRTLTLEMATALNHAARDFLISSGISNEPLTWTPETAVAVGSEEDSDVGWPIALVEDVHRVVASEGLSLSAIAHRLHVEIGIVRALLSSHPVPSSTADTIRRSTGGTTARAAKALSRDQLRDLYVGQRLGLAEIGAQIGVSRQVMTRLARHYGVAVRAAHRPRRAAS